MDRNVCGEVTLVDDILQAEDFVRLRIETGFAEIPIEHARIALQNSLITVSAKGKEPFYEKMGFEIIPNGIKKMIELE